MALLLVFCPFFTGSHCQRGSLHQNQEHPQEHQHSQRAQRKEPSSLTWMGLGLLSWADVMLAQGDMVMIALRWD